MRKFLLLFFILFCIELKGQALEIVYPKTNPAKINAGSTFFIGSTNPCDKLFINDIETPVSQIGAFAQMVPLEVGVNQIKIMSGSETLDFVIERAQPAAAPLIKNELIEYPIINNFYVVNDNAALRMTPVDGGINRMAHLPIDTRVLINGEKEGFYRVYLNSKLYGWIAKSDVTQKDSENLIDNAAIKELKTSEDKEFYRYEFDLDTKIPFIIKEEDGLVLNLYNINKSEDNTYSINVPILRLAGYDAFYDKNKLVFKIRKYPKIDCEKPLKDIVIAVDAGHGGNETGAIGCLGDKEKDINLNIAKNLQQELEKRGAKVVMTRTDDITIPLKDRVQTAKDNDAMILLSIHSNAIPDGQDPIKNQGTSVYYYYNQAKPLATCILDSMTAELSTKNDRVRQKSLALVRSTSSVSVLIEVAYMINPEDCALLINPCFQEKCAKSIADGIENYLLSE